jgi:hypothetical protein
MNKAIFPPSFVGPPSEQQWDAAPKAAVRIKVGDPPGYPRQPVPLDSKGRPFTNENGDIITSELGGLKKSQLIYLNFERFQTLDFKQNLPNLNAVQIGGFGGPIIQL